MNRRAAATLTGPMSLAATFAILIPLLPFDSIVAHGLQRQSPTASQASATLDITDVRRLFSKPPDDSRIMMRWWWFGPAVTKAQLEREMRLMKEGGIGGFEVQPVYPLALDDPAAGVKNLSFLSEEFIEALRFTSEKARELGLRLDLTLGSGWPYGGPQVPITQAAGRLRFERVRVTSNSRRVPMPDMVSGEKLLAVFLARSDEQIIREITDIKDGAVYLPAGLAEGHEVFFFISSRTGMMVKRPAVGAEGFVLDHYDRGAIDSYLKDVGDRLMQSFGEARPYAIFCDSLEVFQSDWTADFLDEFRKRRGYDLKPHLPALVSDLGEKSRAIRCDWGKTLTELLNERFLAPMSEWSKRNRTLFRIQGYGIPPAALSSNALADLPEGEGAAWKVLSACRWASSASHLYGRPVTSSETWTWLHSPVFRATPLDLKAEADLHFLQGINQLIGHGWPYTAQGVEYPGWRFYAAGVFNEKNPWWIVAPDLSLYLQRLSFLLRQGQPVTDVALYLPNSDAYARSSAGRVNLFETLRGVLGPAVVAKVLEAGFSIDFFDDDSLAALAKVERGSLVFGANRYRAVILPGVERIPLATLRKLEEFARSGGVLIATRRTPALAPGFTATEAEHDQVRETSRRLFEGGSTLAHFVQDEERELAGKLASLIRPDVSLSVPAPQVGFVHRTTPSAEVYFVANTGNMPLNVEATFRIEGLQAESWDPISGRISGIEAIARPGEGMAVRLDLEPYGSRVFVFSKRPVTHTLTQAAPVAPPPIDLSTGWRVTFGSGGKPTSMDRLRAWTEDNETRYFSGVATYEKVVIVPEAMLREGLRVRLDFGEGQPVTPRPLRSGTQAWLEGPVREAAVVYVNDRRAGSVWCPPYSLDVTGLLRAGENRLRITVGNLAMNELAGRRLPDYRLLNLRYGVRFEAQDMDKVQAVPAGLFGPIRLISAKSH